MSAAPFGSNVGQAPLELDPGGAVGIENGPDFALQERQQCHSAIFRVVGKSAAAFLTHLLADRGPRHTVYLNGDLLTAVAPCETPAALGCRKLVILSGGEAR
jgi:hypothetical protein